jgi:serine/threonine protein kinase
LGGALLIDEEAASRNPACPEDSEWSEARDLLLNAGTRNPYEITGAIGAGGMGEVYRAHDTKLGRDVAIKVLPANL